MCSNAIQAQNQTDSFEVNEFDSTTGVTWSSIKIMKLTSLCDVYLIIRRIIILHQLITWVAVTISSISFKKLKRYTL